MFSTLASGELGSPAFSNLAFEKAMRASSGTIIHLDINVVLVPDDAATTRCLHLLGIVSST